jgi:hypothetical protein
MNAKNRKLHILGKVSSSVVKKLHELHDLAIRPNELLLFVGYNFYEYSINDLFDIAISGEDQKWRFEYKIKLKKVFDEYGRTHSIIPEGYKTICLFECKQKMPDVIKKLPTLKTWDFTGAGVYLCNHADFNLLHTPETDTVIFSALEGIILSTLKKKQRPFTIQDIEDLLPSESSKFIIDNMLISGSIRKNNEKLEVAV